LPPEGFLCFGLNFAHDEIDFGMIERVVELVTSASLVATIPAPNTVLLGLFFKRQMASP
jgi:hypothetical protein